MGRFTVIFVLILVAAFAATGGASPVSQGDNRSNIVLILADDMRADDFEHMPQTRRLLAEHGLSFSNAFVAHSLCCPSRASVLRGQYTHNHQVLTNARPEGGFEKFRSMGHEASTIATWVKESGYRTVLIGKYLNGYAPAAEEAHVPPGWDEWYGKLRGDDYYDYQINENGEVVSYGEAEEDYFTDVLARKAEDYVRRAADSPRPFFMYLAPATPHAPFVPAPRHEDAYTDVEAPRPPSYNEPDVRDKPAWVRGLSELGPADTEGLDEAYRNRLRMLLSLDEMVAGLVEELQAVGELDDTYIFFTSDNGYHLGEHRLDVGKRTAYEEAVRVPLAVRGPGVFPATTVDEMALNIDLAPTIAELAETSVPGFVDGRSLVPLLNGTPLVSWRSAFLIEHWSGGNGNHRRAPAYVGIRTGTYKYVEHDTGEVEFYDLSADPYELENLYEIVDPTLVQDLESRLEALKSCAGRSCREAEDGL